MTAFGGLNLGVRARSKVNLLSFLRKLKLAKSPIIYKAYR